MSLDEGETGHSVLTNVARRRRAGTHLLLYVGIRLHNPHLYKQNNYMVVSTSNFIENMFSKNT